MPSITEIYQAHADFLWRTLHRLGVRDPDREDALQEVLVVVHRRIDSFDGTSQITSWLFGICLRVASAYRRRAHRRREELVGVPREMVGDQHPSGPEDIAMRNQARETLESILNAMTPLQRAVFYMFEVEGTSCEAIAKIIDVPVATIHSRLRDARKRFRVELARRKDAGSEPKGAP